MIAQLEGEVVDVAQGSVVLGVQGVGYEVSIPLSTYEALPEVGQTVRLLTHLHVREDALLLFGFLTKEERSMFRHLVSVSGIGPKLALGVLSGSSIGNLSRYIASGDIVQLSKLPGIGKKTAQRLTLELKEKLQSAGLPQGIAVGTAVAGEGSILAEGTMALVSLGYNRSDAERTLAKILSTEPDLSLDELIKRSLQKTA